MFVFVFNVLGEFILPKGADIFLPFIKVHRNERYWQNPLVFDPDRFLPHNMTNRHQYSYLPFSNGPRNCIGIYKYHKYQIILQYLCMYNLMIN